MKNKIKNPLFYFGPMSLNIVDAICEFYQTRKTTAGFIPSRRQVECLSLGGGYVNEWTTESFARHVRNKNSNIILERDHAGPLQGLTDDDGIMSILSDIDSKFDIIHIDPWKKFKDVETAAITTSHLIKICLDKNKNCVFEVGTEEGIRKYSPVELEVFLSIVEKDLGNNFQTIKYGVVQSGTNVSGMWNIGNFNFKNSKEMCDICIKFDLIPKEHNSDYLSLLEISERMDAGVRSFNIAPELGVLETTVILDKLKALNLMEQRRELVSTCINSKKWKKWVKKMKEIPEDDVLAMICGHYIFSSCEFANIKSDLLQYTNIDIEIKAAIKNKLRELSCLEK